MSKINIITVSDGNLNALKKTMNSIDCQTFKKFKNIIVSKKKIKKIDNKFKKNRVFIIKKNSSIYDAMNFGLKLSNKKYIIFLNSGDVFYSNKSLEKIKYNSNNFKLGSCLMFVSVLKNEEDYFFPKKKLFNSKNFFTHSSFIRPLVKFDNGFNILKQVTADGNWMKNHKKKFGIKKIYKILTVFYLGGVSNFPSKKSIVMKSNTGMISFIKELLKFFLLRIVGKKFFYRIIYYFKYDRHELKDLNKMN